MSKTITTLEVTPTADAILARYKVSRNPGDECHICTYGGVCRQAAETTLNDALDALHYDKSLRDALANYIERFGLWDGEPSEQAERFAAFVTQAVAQ